MSMIGTVQKATQKRYEPGATIPFFIQLCHLYHSFSPLKRQELELSVLQNPKYKIQKLHNQNPLSQYKDVTYQDLKTSTKKIIRLVAEGIDQRFMFRRYHPIKSLKNWKSVYGSRPTVTLDNVTMAVFKDDFGYEMLCFLVPKMRNLKIIKNQLQDCRMDITR